MKKLSLICLALVALFSASAQNPDAIREIIRNNQNFAVSTVTTYQNIEIGDIAPAPVGFEPFYFSMVGRHGSRYELKDTTFVYTTEVYNRAAKLGILTEEGEHVRQILVRATAEQKGKEGELTSLGQSQWRGIGRRAYQNFGELFAGASIEAKSSTKMRCVFSMVAFMEGLKEKNTNIVVEQEARESFLPMLRPMMNHPDTPRGLTIQCRRYARTGAWRKTFTEEMLSKHDFTPTIAKLTTNPDALIKECGAHSLFSFISMTHHLLLFSQNLGFDTYDTIQRIFTVEDLYRFYCYNAAMWVNLGWGYGNDNATTYISYLRPLIEDILGKAQEAIDGKNPHVANMRFTHDSYFIPMTTVLGLDGCTTIFDGDVEKAATSAPLCKVCPMGANLQMLLYRNTKGEVLVRLLLNENDITLPIECKSAPFYPWSSFRTLVEENMAKLDREREEIHSKKN
jgi:hypothetical protein